ncbi:hypothetical protein RB653_000630 [Dictyostelium firmibasis]|uniref:Uncharacterized protein n=1 Tax=Dictyostelium firmibasis TaxID=79012 RepID=A0AAN7UFL2_9MYCE
MCFQKVSAQSLSNDITLLVDFSSTVSYSNNECGGILVSSDPTVYPPCSSFKDAGNRARQYLNSGLVIPNSNSLTIKAINTEFLQSISGESAQLGNLFGFCSIQILVKTTTSPVIADGTLSTSNFISLEEPNVPNTSYTCSSPKLLLIKFINFINWGDQTILYTNVKQNGGVITKQNIYLVAIITSNSNSIINVLPKDANFEYGSLEFFISSCSFRNLFSLSALPPFNFIGSKVNIASTGFLDSTINSSPFIYLKVGHINIKVSSVIDHVVINNGFPFVKTLNLGDNFYYNNVNITNCIFSKFLQHENNKVDNLPKEVDISQIFGMNINNNIITSNSNDPLNSFFSFQNFPGVSYTLNILFVSVRDNQVSGDKSLISNENSNTFIANFEIPNTFPIGINTQNSNNNVFSSNIDSNIPFAGNNSIFSYNGLPAYTVANINNFDCDVCQISVEGVVVYDHY